MTIRHQPGLQNGHGAAKVVSFVAPARGPGLCFCSGLACRHVAPLNSLALSGLISDCASKLPVDFFVPRHALADAEYLRHLQLKFFNPKSRSAAYQYLTYLFQHLEL